jgi:uncharacterized protein YecT (DUF1311 family)
MRIYSLLLIGVVTFVASGMSDALPAGDHSQLGMNQESAAKLATDESEMAKVLGKLAAKAKGNPEAIAKLDRAQAAWRAYRDAQVDAMWPFPERTWYGSVNPMCVADARSVLTKARISELRAMLEPAEYDVCSSQWPD